MCYNVSLRMLRLSWFGTVEPIVVLKLPLKLPNSQIKGKKNSNVY